MNSSHPKTQPAVTMFCLLAVAMTAGLISAPPAQAEKIYSFDDQYIQIEAKTVPTENRPVFGIEVNLTPKPGWKLLASNSSSVRPLRLKLSPGKCLQLKGAGQQSAPDWSGTDDSGAFSEYFTNTATIRQDFSRLKCTDRKGFAGSATISYLLCQDNRCVGPFSREFRFSAPAVK